MDFLAGRIFRHARLPGVAPAERAAIHNDHNASWARLHQADLGATGRLRDIAAEVLAIDALMPLPPAWNSATSSPA